MWLPLVSGMLGSKTLMWNRMGTKHSGSGKGMERLNNGMGEGGGL
jgi:hypothetical protein